MEMTNQMNAITLIDRLSRAGEGFSCGEGLTAYGNWWLARAEEFGRALTAPAGPVTDGVWELICSLASDEDVIGIRVARFSDASEE